MKILHGPTKVGNQSWFLSRAERALGHESDHVANYDTWVKFPSDRDLGAWKTKDMNELRERAVFGMTAPFDYDVLHYNFGRSFMYWDDHEIHNHAPYADLKLAKSLHDFAGLRYASGAPVRRDERVHALQGRTV